MKNCLKFLLLISILITISSCSYIFDKKKSFEPTLVQTGYAYKLISEDKNHTYMSGPHKGEKMYYRYIIVIDSCGNQTTYRTTDDCFNSINESADKEVKNLPVQVFTTEDKKIFEVKKIYIKNEHE